MSKKESPDNTVVYQWVRGDGTPYYVGIGNPQRPYKGKRTCGSPPSKDRIVVLHENLSWEEACKIEIELIAYHGRKDLDTGILRNMTDGGEGPKGYIHSEESRRKISECHKGKTLTEEHKRKISDGVSGENHPNFGKSLPKETKEKISKSLKSFDFSGERNPMYGEKHTERVKEKMSGKNNYNYKPRNWYHPDHGEILNTSAADLIKMFPDQNLDSGHLSKVAMGKNHSHKGWVIYTPVEPIVKRSKSHSEETKRKISEAQKGEKSYMYGKRLSEETKEKIGDSQRGEKHRMYGKKQSDEVKKKISERLSRPDNPNRIPRDWQHPEYGTIRNVPICELIKMFPEQKLTSCGLSNLANSKSRTHKGWICLTPTK